MSYQDVHEGRQKFRIGQIESSNTGNTPKEIRPEYERPDISLSTGGKFTKHEIIGGAVVRQRTGDKPIELSIKGVAFESTANNMALLRNAKSAKVFSDRLPGDSIQVHIISISTDPMQSGGAAPIHGENFNEPELLYTYNIECVEILDTATEEIEEGETDVGQIFEGFVEGLN